MNFRRPSLSVALALAFGCAAPAAQAFENPFAFLFSGRSAASAPSYSDGQLAGEASSTRSVVADPTRQRPGTITVDTQNRYLYLSMNDGQAIRYGVGVGRPGFTWRGHTHIGRKEAWPAWTPPSAMLHRRPDLPRHMSGGANNPLGARAMYLYSGGRDTMFRIHGSNEPWTIGHGVSSGCIRMLNGDVTDLYSRVKVGTQVHVL
ncbi:MULTISPECIES: L,D-transpeptidase [Methylosinus]|uniref:L,D-transpeptidase n=1 Tax=Methylosinus sporium TaxID=428 RepID=A0A2U1ST62_METSR|nr:MULTISPECIES: L,D-transpeptidase [Methylosinus]MBU3887693.1 L,D-transpeptidase [Methylosinus sp. KRF6]PWB94806.1 L,D-transpeptidase [Methylosinus sporium]TRL38321.1 L,D-transpeptidase [Methylosinus sporium]